MLIKRERSIIPACDVESLRMLENVVKDTYDIEHVGGYKIGFSLVLRFGIPRVLEVIRKYTDKPVIYDHQKAGTDIPDTAYKFMNACRDVDGVIIFPQSGPETERTWIKAAFENNLTPIVGGEMTHKGYLEGENGFLKSDTPERIYRIAAELGVKDFVIPGNRQEKVKRYRRLIESFGVHPVFYAPGFVVQGGDIGEFSKIAGKRWHIIVGRAIYNSENIRESVMKIIEDTKL